MVKNSNHVERQLGVWLIITNKHNYWKPKWAMKLWEIVRRIAKYPSGFFLLRDSEESVESGDEALARRQGLTNFRMLKMFVAEIHSLSPLYFWISFGLRGWWVMANSAELYSTSMLLDGIKTCLEAEECSSSKMYLLVCWLIFFTVLSNYIWKLGERYSAKLKGRVKHHYAAKKMREVMRFDLQTSQDSEVQSKLHGGDLTDDDSNGDDYMKKTPEAWKAFDGLCDLVFGVLQMSSHLVLVLNVSRGGTAFALTILLCFVHPIVSFIEHKVNYLYQNSFVSYCTFDSYRRMAALYSIAQGDGYAEDRIMNNFAGYISTEFEKSRKELGDVDTEINYVQWFRNQPLWSGSFSDLSTAMPLLFFAIAVTWDRESFSLSSLIMLQQIMEEFQTTTSRVFYKVKNFYEYIRTIRNIYLLSEVPNLMKDGLIPYPAQGDNLIYKSGAQIEFKNVTFRYPGTDRDVISDVSFTIKSGQLVVIVGVNGSGKSSTIKLFSRLFDPTSGEILLDDKPLTSYRISDVRRTTAILRQDHPILPLSLRENVALGQTNMQASKGDIEEAIKQGGATHFMAKLKDGLETVTCPTKTTETWFCGEPDPELKAEIEGIDKKTDLSGGETQRLSASRTFLRLMGGGIRLLIADEPTSALDPEGEYEQFTRLRAHSGGKTVIFITHRFGHLTKHADLILCMKDGKLVEQGKHDDLIKNDGEYKKLYEIQSRAFTEGVEEAGEGDENAEPQE